MIPQIENLKKSGYEVVQFTDFHFRINRRLDIYPNAKMHRPWKWRDIKTGENGGVDKQEAKKFAMSYLAALPAEPAPKPPIFVPGDRAPVTFREKFVDAYVRDNFDEMWKLVEDEIAAARGGA